MTKLLGIDCSTDPRKTGMAMGDVVDGVARMTHCATGSRDALPVAIALEWLAGCEDVVIGLDAPLGWPRALGAELSKHQAGAHIGVDSNALFRRVTDGDIKRRLGKQPLDVGADRIARTAAAALRLIDALRMATGRRVPLAWSPRERERWTAIEVYPAATRIAHGAPAGGGSIEGLAAALDCSGVMDAVRRSPDAADACVCALAVADFLAGRAVPPADEATARVEGWIWVADPS